MKIIQINAWMGRLAPPLIRFIADESPDILCLQESIRPDARVLPPFLDQFNFISQVREAGRFSYESFSPNWGFLLGDIVLEEGLYILSKFPLREELSLHLSGKYHVVRTAQDAINEARNLQICTAILPSGASLAIANYQGLLDGPVGIGSHKTEQTLRQMVRHISTISSPIVVCADLNVWPSSPSMKILEESSLRNLTIEYGASSTLSDVHRAPESDRLRAISDYVLVSKDLQVTDFRISPILLSDHRATVVEIAH